MKRLTLAITLALAACGGMPDEVEDGALAEHEEVSTEQGRDDTPQDGTEPGQGTSQEQEGTEEHSAATLVNHVGHCGGNIITYRSGLTTYQRLTYISCSSRTLRRKADIVGRGDGNCKTIPPYHTVVLATVAVHNGYYIRGSREC